MKTNMGTMINKSKIKLDYVVCLLEKQPKPR
jgi:hypothetical protein